MPLLQTIVDNICGGLWSKFVYKLASKTIAFKNGIVCLAVLYDNMSILIEQVVKLWQQP